MALSGIGNNNVTGTDQRQEILFATYSYQNGKGQEKVYYARDCVEISMDSYTIPPAADNYEEVRNTLKAQNSGKIASLGNQMFYETYDVMKDYYDGKLSRDEVKDIFKEYFYHYMGTSLAARKEDSAAGVQPGNCYMKQFATSRLAGLYEYFSRANTRLAHDQNQKEGKALMESHGIRWSGTYYNADWYYACEEMQELFRETADELADEYGVDRVDFRYVEENTRFTLDGGITYNGVWDAVKWQADLKGPVQGGFLDKNMVPPRGFVYCSTGFVWDGKGDLEGIKEEIRSRRKDYSSTMIIWKAAQDVSAGGSMLLDPKNYNSSSVWEENDAYRSAVSFLKNFNMNWNFTGARWEFLMV